MNAIPTKVFAVLGAEAGMFVGLGIILAFTIRTMYRVTVDHRWADLSYIERID